MNEIDLNPDYKKIYDYIADKYKKTDYLWHGNLDETFFSLRVYEYSKELIKKLKKNVNVSSVLVASLLHDIGKTKLNKENIEKDWSKHSEYGEIISNDYLESLGHSKEFIEQVCYLVKNHDNRKIEHKTIELQIVQDADYLADTGLVGYFRPFMDDLESKRPIIDTIKLELNLTNSRLNLDRINLDISKKIIKKHSLMEKKYFIQLGKLINSNLIK